MEFEDLRSFGEITKIDHLKVVMPSNDQFILNTVTELNPTWVVTSNATRVIQNGQVTTEKELLDFIRVQGVYLDFAGHFDHDFIMAIEYADLARQDGIFQRCVAIALYTFGAYIGDHVYYLRLEECSSFRYQQFKKGFLEHRIYRPFERTLKQELLDMPLGTTQLLFLHNKIAIRQRPCTTTTLPYLWTIIRQMGVSEVKTDLDPAFMNFVELNGPTEENVILYLCSKLDQNTDLTVLDPNRSNAVLAITGDPDSLTGEQITLLYNNTVGFHVLTSV